MNQDALRILAKELTGEQFKVLMLMLADLDYENFIQIAQADIADTLEMQKTNVSRAVRALLDVRVIFERAKVGRSKTYRLNEQFGWKGTASNHKRPSKTASASSRAAELNQDTLERVNSSKRLRGDSRPFFVCDPRSGENALGGRPPKMAPANFSSAHRALVSWGRSPPSE